MNKMINNPEQVAYVRRYTLNGGASDGIKVVEVYNGVLRLLLNESKALDIMQMFHQGTNISYLSKNTFTKRETDFMSRFEGGMLYTCDVDVVGDQTGYENHGSLHNMPALVTRCECNEKEIIVEATIRNTELFGRNLVLRRRYETKVCSGTVTLCDELSNEGWRDENYSMLYHVNVGYPMLDDETVLIADVAEIVPRNEWSQANIATALVSETPQDGREETCYYLNLNKSSVSLVNKHLAKKFTLSYNGEELPHFIEWKSMASGDYALGLEPSTTRLGSEFSFSTLKAQKKISFRLSFDMQCI